MGLPTWAWYALAVVGACRMTIWGFDAAVRRVVRIASLAREQHSPRARVPAPPAAAHPARPATLPTSLPIDPGRPLTAPVELEEQ